MAAPLPPVEEEMGLRRDMLGTVPKFVSGKKQAQNLCDYR